VAVKTGTSSNYHDAWTVAYSHRYLVAAWVGHPDYRSMDRLSGYRSAARLVQQIMLHLHEGERDGLEDVGFPPPRGHVPVRLCALTGLRAGPACDQVFLEHFAPGHEPTEACTAHVQVAVDRRSGRPATSRTPSEWVEVRTFTELGPRYAEWQARQGLARPPLPGSAAGPTRSGGCAGALGVRSGGAPAHLDVTSPEPDLRLVRDPETPPERATMALKAAVDPPAEQVVWYVDGAPFAIADYPYVARWPLEPGVHTFQARLPFSEVRSRTVSVTVY
jgi:penicillin-binding protein 1C